MTTAAPSRLDVAAVVDFACLVALDPAISADAIRDALLVVSARPPASSPQLETLVQLSHVRAECWRQLRARGIHPDTQPEVRLDAEPLAALSPLERTALYLMTRRGLTATDAGYVMDAGPREVTRLRVDASVALVRARTALALSLDPTPCPVRDHIVARGAGMLNRKDIVSLTLHAAECRICIDLLRRADATALSGYSALPAAGDAQVDAVLDALAAVPQAERDRVVRRAGVLRRDGRPPRRERFDRDPQYWLKRAIALGAASVVLLLVGMILLKP